MPGIFNAIKYKQEMTEPWKTVHNKLNYISKKYTLYNII